MGCDFAMKSCKELMEKMTHQESSPGILKHAGTVTFFTLLSRILGATRDLVIAHFFGAGWITDAFIQAFTIPNVLRRLTAEGAMNQAFLPLVPFNTLTSGTESVNL